MIIIIIITAHTYLHDCGGSVVELGCIVSVVQPEPLPEELEGPLLGAPFAQAIVTEASVG